MRSFMDRRGPASGTALIAFLAAFALVAPTTSAATRPDLKITSAKGPPVAVAGRPIVVIDRVRSTRAPAGPSVTRYYLSRDRKKSKRDRRLSGIERVAKLRAGQSRRGVARLGVPHGLRGQFFVIACADDRRKVRERSERNNCRTAKKRVEILKGYGKPKPRKVTLQLDLARRDTSEVSPESGGFLFAADAGGTTYSLSIPPGALASPQEISITPVTGVQGLPVGGFAGGVQMDPDGLALLKPATLTIEPADSLPAQTSVFGWFGAGSDFHFAPHHAGAPLELSVTHFSGAGSSSSPPAPGASVPSDPEAQAKQSIAKSLDDLQSGRISKEEADRRNAEAIRTWYYGEIRPTLDIALNEDDYFTERAVIDYVGWVALIQAGLAADLLGAEAADAKRRVDQAVDQAWQRTRQRCRDSDIAQVARLSRLIRFYWGGIAHRDDTPDLLAELRQCLRFELRVSFRFDDVSTGTNGDGSFVFADLHAEVEVPLVLDTAVSPPVVRGSSSLKYSSFSLQGNDCPYTVTDYVESQPIGVPRVLFNLNVDQYGAKLKNAVVDFLEFDPGYYYEEITENCPGNGASTEYTAGFENGWIRAHEDEYAFGLFEIKEWTEGDAGTFARRAYSRTINSPFEPKPFTENTTFQLVHTPAP